MKKIILHIGVAKTGTSIIQTALSNIRKSSLLDSGYYYPESVDIKDSEKGRATTGNGAFLAKWLNDQCPVPKYDINWSPKELLSDIASKNLNAVVSSEYLMGFNEIRMKEFVKSANDVGYRIEIVAYFRSIAGHAASSYAQHVKRAHYSEDFENFVNCKYKNVFMPLVNKLERNSDFFSVKAFNYDLHRENIVNHFLENVLELPKIEGIDKKNINRSLTYTELETLRLINKFTKDVPNGKLLANRVSDYLLEEQPNKASYRYLSPEASVILADKYQNTVSAVNRFLPESEAICLYLSTEDAIEKEMLSLKEQREIFAKSIALALALN